jgi:hypothetical protein
MLVLFLCFCLVGDSVIKDRESNVDIGSELSAVACIQSFKHGHNLLIFYGTQY